MQTLAELKECFQLYAVCEPCDRFIELDIDALIMKNGGTYRIDRLRLRLTCDQCHTRSQAMRIVYVGPNRKVAGFRYS